MTNPTSARPVTAITYFFPREEFQVRAKRFVGFKAGEI
jgi:hypothetical protein